MGKTFRVTAVAVAALALASCSSAGSSSETAAVDPSPAACDKATLQPAVNDAADALGRGNTMPIDQVECADGWAVTTGNLLPKNEPAVFIFQSQNSAWVWQEPATACGKSADNSAVPAQLWPMACDSQ